MSFRHEYASQNAFATCDTANPFAQFLHFMRGIRFARSNVMAKPRKQSHGDFENQTAPQNVGDTTAAVPDRDRIALRAYEIYLSRGAADGAAMDDWLTAERELNQEHESTIEH